MISEMDNWIQALAHPQVDKRRAAVFALQTLDHPEAIPALVECLNQENDPQLKDLIGSVLKYLSRPEKTLSPRDPYGLFRI